MSPDELRVYQSLGEGLGGKVSDPKYHQFPEQHERLLEKWVRQNWGDRRLFPDWVSGYIKKWTQQKESLKESQSAESKPGNCSLTIPSSKASVTG